MPDINFNFPLILATNPKPNKELLDALQEGEDIIQEIRDGKRDSYNNVNEMLKAIIDD